MISRTSLAVLTLLGLFVPCTAFTVRGTVVPRRCETSLRAANLMNDVHVEPIFTAASSTLHSGNVVSTGSGDNIQALSNEANVAVFIIGLIPFGWATVEFWRRIAVGASFGTGKDSVVIIGEDGAPSSSRGRQVLGKGALAVAYGLFTVAFLSIAVAVFSVLTAPPMPVITSDGV